MVSAFSMLGAAPASAAALPAPAAGESPADVQPFGAPGD